MSLRAALAFFSSSGRALPDLGFSPENALISSICRSISSTGFSNSSQCLVIIVRLRSSLDCPAARPEGARLKCASEKPYLDTVRKPLYLVECLLHGAYAELFGEEEDHLAVVRVYEVQVHGRGAGVRLYDLFKPLKDPGVQAVRPGQYVRLPRLYLIGHVLRVR